MRSILYLLKSFTWICSAGLVVISCQTGSSLELSNPSNLTLTDHPVIISRHSFKNVKGLPVIKDASGEIIPAQPEDIDQDGTWDQLVFQRSFEPKEKQHLQYDWVAKGQYPQFVSRTKVYLGYSPQRNGIFSAVETNERPSDHVAQSTPYLYQYEGPGWESELVAFRSYFDSRNGKDIFGKIIPQLIIDSIGLGEDYHTLQDWGMDVLKVGTSLGAGALAILKNDSLYRLTDTGKATFRIISNGSVRSVFELKYEDWQINESSYDLVETITIWGGKRWYESQIKLLGGSPEDTVVTGIVNLKQVPSFRLESAGWQVLYSHGKQSENDDFLGMSLFVPDIHFAGFGEAPGNGKGVTNTYTAYLKPENRAYKFMFYAGWQGEDPKFEDKLFFEKQLISEAKQLNQTLETNLDK